MAKIALRVYNNEISDLIESGRVNEAIAHCLHILELFPRHVDTYRLLGKAYLEGKQYRDAADIFQRVLSSIPDDFIANVGMSIVREAEGDLPSAIYHMERTFERQPSNQVIQEELRRLYGKRDGIVPAKTRLTRGALARMYAHGNLYDQAAAELVAALSEEPQRLDLQVLLADLYFTLHKHDDAIDICMHILGILPNSITANRILYLVFKDGPRHNEAAEYHKRWAAMEPYAAFVSEAQSDVSAVPDSMVTLDRLDIESEESEFGEIDEDFWSTPEPESAPAEPISSEEVPDWLKNSDDDSFGDSSPADEAPDWLADLSGLDSETAEPDIPETVSEGDDQPQTEEPVDVPPWLNSPAIEERIPTEELEPDSAEDWLKPTAGGTSIGMEDQEENNTPQPTLDEILSTPAPQETEDAGSEPEESDLDMPAWMQGLAQRREAETAESPDWLADVEGEDDGEEGDSPDWLQELEPDKSPEEGGLDWLQTGESETAESETVEEESDELEWLKRPATDTDTVSDDEPAPKEAGESVTQDNDNLDWLNEPVQQDEAKEEPEEDDLDWLNEPVQQEESKEDGLDGLNAAESKEKPEDDDLDWLKQPDDNEENDDNTPDWLKGLTADVEAPAAELESGEQESSDDLTPDWMQAEAKQPTADEDNTPGWMKDLGSETAESSFVSSAETGDEETADSSEDVEDDLDWLQELGEPQHPEGDSGQDTWSRLFQEQDEDKGGSPPSQPMKTASISDEDEEDDDPLSWLNDLPATNSLSRTQEIKVDDETEPEPASEFEQEKEEEPLDIGGVETQAMEVEDSSAAESLLEDDDLDWIDEVLHDDPLDAPPGEAPVETTTSEAEDEDEPSWLSALDDDEEEITASGESEEEGSPGETAEDVKEFEWIESPAAAPTEEKKAEPAADNEDWLQSLLEEEDSLIGEHKSETGAEEESSEEATVEVEQESEYSVLEEESPEAWLESFEEETQDEASPELDEETLNWLDDLDLEDEDEGAVAAAEATEPEETAEGSEIQASTAGREEKPEWLKSMNDAEAGDKPSWLKNLTQEQEREEEAEGPATDEVDEWLKYLSEPVQPSSTQSAADIEAVEETEKADVKAAAPQAQPAQAETGRDELPHIEADNDLDESIKKYSYMIRKGRDLEQIVESLRETLHSHPMDARLWQVLGDAYMRLDRLQEALDSYTQAENLLR